jgi:large subunit ribosomal protein L28
MAFDRGWSSNMSAVCEVCGKSPSFGKSVSRLGRNALVRRVKSRTNRRWTPNIQQVRGVVNGQQRRVRVCTRCLKAGKVARPAR